MSDVSGVRVTAANNNNSNRTPARSEFKDPHQIPACPPPRDYGENPITLGEFLLSFMFGCSNPCYDNVTWEGPGDDDDIGDDDIGDDDIVDDDTGDDDTTEPCMEDYCLDADGDGYGDAGSLISIGCDEEPPEGYVQECNDCDDTDSDIYPGATEICNGIDDDCDGDVDEGFPMVTYCDDDDGDSYGDPNDTLDACYHPDGYVLDCTDCDDTEALVNPGMPEDWDTYYDDDCDGCPIVVDVNASGNEDGTAANPFSDIQEGIDNIDFDIHSGCYEVNVLAGTYPENLLLDSASLDYILGVDPQAVIVLRGWDGADLTTIDGSAGSDTVIYIDTAVPVDIEGFTVTGGQSTIVLNIIYGLGGGILVEDSDASLTAMQNILTGNVGGAILIYDAQSGLLLNNVITGNEVEHYDDELDQYGAIGAGIYVYLCDDCLIYNNVVDDNVAPRSGVGGISLGVGATATAYNNTITSNLAGGIWIADPAVSSADYNTLYDNWDVAGVEPQNYCAGDPGEHDLVDVDPLYNDPLSLDYSLQIGSQCIDAGHPDALFDDVDGTRNDMGAYGGPYGDW